MSFAEDVKAAFEEQERDSEGFYPDPPREFLRGCTYTKEELCPKSYDSSLRVVFDDGSVLQIGNPAQAAFAGFMIVEK